MKKLLTVLIVLSMAVTALTGCSENEEPTVVKETVAAEVATDVESSEPVELVISTWGYNEDKLRENLFGPFEEANNVTIILETGNNSDRLNKIRSMENSSVDLIFLAESYAIQGIEEGLFEEIDSANIPNLENIYEMAKAPHGEAYGPAYTLNSTGIIYDSAAVDVAVASWSDLWNTAFENNAAIPEITTTAGPSMVILAGEAVGVDAFEDTDAAFAKLVEIKPNLVKTFSRSSELVNMFAQGEVVIGVAQSFAYGSIKEALPTAEWVNPTEGAFANLNTINIVKGSDNKELAEKFIDWCLSEAVQKANALDKIDSPVNVNVALTEEEASGLIYGAELIESLRTVDSIKVNDMLDEWIDKWNREVSN